MDISNYKDYLINIAKDILRAHSPSGYTPRITAVMKKAAAETGTEIKITNKGTFVLSLPGKSSKMKIGLAAHCDTLGAMVRYLRDDGGVNFIKVGGPLMCTLDGEYCTLITRDEKEYTGTFLSLSPSVHVFSDASTRERNPENMYVRLDVNEKTAAELRSLGIEKGNYICIDPKTVVTDSGYIKSRFLDDKISVACILTAVRIMKDQGIVPRYDTEIIFTMYEEVGHGASSVPEGIGEMLAVDMGCVGSDLECTEKQVSVCVADSNGPYNYELTNRLISLCKKHGINFAADIYPHYGSDIRAALVSGNDIKGALIGSGVHASHGMERTHIDGLVNTIKLIIAFLTENE